VFKSEEVSLAQSLPKMYSVPKEGETKDVQLL